MRPAASGGRVPLCFLFNPNVNPNANLFLDPNVNPNPNLFFNPNVNPNPNFSFNPNLNANPNFSSPTLNSKPSTLNFSLQSYEIFSEYPNNNPIIFKEIETFFRVMVEVRK